MKKLFIFLLFIFLAVFFGQIQAERYSLSKKERKILEKDLRYLFFHAPFAFTLFGDKPITTYTYYFDPGVLCEHCCDPNFDDQLFWKLWLKATNSLKITRYIFQQFEYKRNGATAKGYILVNKPAFVDCFNLHQEEFRKYLGYDITATTILDSIEAGKGIFMDKIYHHDFLIGILFGFGKENVQKFCQHNSEMKAFCKPLIIHPFFHKITLLPQFAADFSLEETKSLDRKYRQQLKEIRKFYRKQNFLEVTLAKLAQ